MTSDIQGMQHPRRLALLIGVSAYSEQRGFTPLKYPSVDVEHLARVLQTGPTPYEVRCLTDLADPTQRPDSQNVARQLRVLLESAGPDDTLLLYFSGHGLSRQDDTWLMPNDVYRDSPELGAVSVRGLRAQFLESRAAVRVVIVDACHASVPGHRGFVLELEPGAEAADLPKDETVVDLSEAATLHAGRGFAFLASCAHSQLAWEHPSFKMGVFTHFLVRGLEGEAASDESIGLDALFRFVSAQVAHFSQESGRPQTPIYQTEISMPITVHRLRPRERSDASPDGSPQRIAQHTVLGIPDPEPYRFLSAFTEADVGRFFGREAELEVLCYLVRHNRFVLVKAPSGAGKTSLLRAGLLPRLQDEAALVYLDCRGDVVAELIRALDAWRPGNSASQRGGAPSASNQPPAEWLADSLRRHFRLHGRRIVLILDQLERVFLGSGASRQGTALEDALALLPQLHSWTVGPDQVPFCVVLAIREDLLYLADALRRRLELPPDRELRIELLRRDQALDAICLPVAGQVTFQPNLLERLLDDLIKAGQDVNATAGFPEREGIFPPHLQLVCHELFVNEIRPRAGHGTLALEHYRGLDQVISRQIEGALEYMSAPRRLAARALLKALVGVAGTRQAVPEAQLVSQLEEHFGAEAVAHVIHVLVDEKRLVVRPRGTESGCLELAHDFLVKRIEAWSGPEETERRLARERLLAYEFERRRTPGHRLDRRSVVSILSHPGLLQDFRASERERLSPLWEQVLRDRRYYQVRTAVTGLALAALVALGVALFLVNQAQEREVIQDLGRFELELTVFDLDAQGRATAQDPSLFPGLTWTLAHPSQSDAHEVGETLPSSLIQLEALHPEGLARRWRVTTQGGPRFLRISGRGRTGEDCPPSVLPVRRLPGYVERSRKDDALPVIALRLPSCQASRMGMREVPSGPYYAQVDVSDSSAPAGGGPGDRLADLDGFWMDTHEVRNHAFARFGCLEAVTGIGMPPYTQAAPLAALADPRQPASAMTWYEASAYCRFMGKELPTSAQWTKAARGGLTLGAQQLNRDPRRRAPWGNQPPAPVGFVSKVLDEEEQPSVPRALPSGAGGGPPSPAGDFWNPCDPRASTGLDPFSELPASSRTYPPEDSSPYGIVALALGVQEWTRDPAIELHSTLFRRLRGGSWFDLEHWNIDSSNARRVEYTGYATGFRCVLDAGP